MKETDENIEKRIGNLKKDLPFKVPEGYFETFADRLMARIEEEQQPNKKRSLFFYLKPALMVAASLAFVMLLVYVPINKYFSTTGKTYLVQQKADTDSVDSAGGIPATMFSYFSEGQFLSAVEDMNKIDAETISNDNLADFIAANYNDYDVIVNN